MDVDVANTICWLVQSDRIYKNNQLNYSEFDRFLGRISRTPLKAMEQWGAASEPKRGIYEAVVELAGLDELYEQTGFKNDVFKTKLAIRNKK